MGFKITVPLEALHRPRVAEALHALVQAIAAEGVHDAVSVEDAGVPAAFKEASAGTVRRQAQAYHDFVAALPLRSQAFLTLVRSRGVVRLHEVIAELGLDGPKAVGGITGAIGRWAPVRGIPLPYEAIVLTGERAWRWIRAESPVAEVNAAAPSDLERARHARA